MVESEHFFVSKTESQSEVVLRPPAPAGAGVAFELAVEAARPAPSYDATVAAWTQPAVRLVVEALAPAPEACDLAVDDAPCALPLAAAQVHLPIRSQS